jgi:hypothetical protein
MGGMVVACKNGTSSSTWRSGGTDVVMFSLVRRFWCMGGMAVACKNRISSSILAYGWHGVRDVPIGPSILVYGRHGGREHEWYKSIHFGVWVAWK